jgi:hypothetical protein
MTPDLDSQLRKPLNHSLSLWARIHERVKFKKVFTSGFSDVVVQNVQNTAKKRELQNYFVLFNS